MEDAGDTRIFELSPTAAKLRCVVTAPVSAVQPLSSGRLAVQLEEGGLAIADPRTRAQRAIQGQLLAQSADYLFIGDSKGVMRLKQGDLAPSGRVDVHDAEQLTPDNVQLLGNGAALSVPDALVSFGSQVTVHRGVTLASASADGTGALVCNSKSQRFEVLDVLSGAVTARGASCAGLVTTVASPDRSQVLGCVGTGLVVVNTRSAAVGTSFGVRASTCNFDGGAGATRAA